MLKIHDRAPSNYFLFTYNRQTNGFGTIPEQVGKYVFGNDIDIDIAANFQLSRRTVFM